MTRMTDRRTAVMASTALLPGLLAGCNGDTTDPTTTTSTSSTSISTTSNSSTSTTSSPTACVPVKPKFPAAAKKQTEQGAVAFVEYYWESVVYALTAPDPEILVPLTSKSCDKCNFYIDLAEEMQVKKDAFESPMLEVRQVTMIVWAGNYLRAKADLSLLAAKRVASSGEVNDEQTQELASFHVSLAWVGSGWRVRNLGDL